MNLFKNNVMAFVLFIFFLGFTQNRVEGVIYADTAIANPTFVRHYFYDSCRFYDFRITHPRRCSHRYDHSYHNFIPFPFFRQDYRHHYWHRPYSWHHHHWRHHRWYW